MGLSVPVDGSSHRLRSRTISESGSKFHSQKRTQRSGAQGWGNEEQVLWVHFRGGASWRAALHWLGVFPFHVSSPRLWPGHCADPAQTPLVSGSAQTPALGSLVIRIIVVRTLRSCWERRAWKFKTNKMLAACSTIFVFVSVLFKQRPSTHIQADETERAP